MDTYLEHWSLNESPFEDICSPRFFFGSRQHREALERLLYIVRDGNMGFGLLTGEIGSGKTMLARVLQSHLMRNQYETVMLENSYHNYHELLVEVLSITQSANTRRRALIASRSYKKDSCYELQCRLRDLMNNKLRILKRHLVLILDEAQEISAETLIELKGLTNFSASDRNSVTILLVGQSELGEQVQELKQIDQRIGLRYHLKPLSPEESAEYIDARMRLAGYEGTSAFSDEAKMLLFSETDGIPRELNRICKLALDRAFAARENQVTGMTVEQIVEDMFQQKAFAF